MTEREYNEAPGIRRSDLWKIRESPEKFLWATTHPVETSPAMLFGAAAHKLILEGTQEFATEFAVAPVVDKRTKAGKDEWERFCAANKGKTIVSEDDFCTMFDMGGQICKCNLADELLHGKDGETEVPFFWTDKDTGEECKVKLDRLLQIEGKYVVVDYKTAANAETEEFCRSIIRYGYHLQAAMYTEAVMVEKKLNYRPDFIFVVQEKKEPYSVNVVRVSGDSNVMLYGIDTFRELIGTLHNCKALNYFPGYLGMYGEMNDAELPGWVLLNDEE